MIFEASGDGRGAWTFRYTSPVTGKRREPGLGVHPGVSLAAARTAADKLRERVKAGGDPLIDAEREAEAERAAQAARELEQARNAATVEAVAKEVYRALAPTFRNVRHSLQWINSLERHVFPTLGARPVASVTPSELLNLLLPLRDKLPETTRRLRQRLETVFERAALRGLLSGPNPATALRRALRTKSTKQHFAAIDYRDAPAFVAKLRDNPAGYVSARLALEFALLAAARTGEVLGATWGEVNEAERIWIIPGARMKRGIEHRVPLTPRMLEILAEARALAPADAGSLSPLFPSPMNLKRPLSNMAMLNLLGRMKTGAKLPDGTDQTYRDVTTTHGACRSTFSTYCRERTRVKESVIEAALAHTEKNAVAAAYSRADYWRERVELAHAWERYVTTPAQSVVVAFPAKS